MWVVNPNKVSPIVHELLLALSVNYNMPRDTDTYLYYSIHRVGSVVLGGGRRHVPDLGGLARPIKTSGFARPPSEVENIAAAESETGIHPRRHTHPHVAQANYKLKIA